MCGRDHCLPRIESSLRASPNTEVTNEKECSGAVHAKRLIVGNFGY